MLPAIIIQIIWIGLVYLFRQSVDFKVIGILLTCTSDSELISAFKNLQQHLLAIIIYFSTIMLFSIYAGFFTRVLIASRGFDKEIESDFLIIPYREIKNLNFSYIYAEDDTNTASKRDYIKIDEIITNDDIK